MSIVKFPTPTLYEAKAFRAQTEAGAFEASGTLCGHVDLIGPFSGTFVLSPDEVRAVISMLQQALADVLENSDPHGDPRLKDTRP